MDIDINGFEVIGKVVRRTEEALMDSYCAVEEAFNTDLLRGLICRPGSFAQEQQGDIMNAATEALAHNNLKETEHQLNREIYFSSIFPHEHTNVFHEAEAQNGLNALHAGHNAREVRHAMRTDCSTITTALSYRPVE